MKISIASRQADRGEKSSADYRDQDSLADEPLFVSDPCVQTMSRVRKLNLALTGAVTEDMLAGALQGFRLS